MTSLYFYSFSSLNATNTMKCFIRISHYDKSNILSQKIWNIFSFSLFPLTSQCVYHCHLWIMLTYFSKTIVWFSAQEGCTRKEEYSWRDILNLKHSRKEIINIHTFENLELPFWSSALPSASLQSNEDNWILLIIPNKYIYRYYFYVI